MKFSRHLAQKNRDHFVNILKDVKSINCLPKAVYGASSRRGRDVEFMRMIKSNSKFVSNFGKEVDVLKQSLPNTPFTIEDITKNIVKNKDLLNSWHIHNKSLPLEDKKILCCLMLNQKSVCKKTTNRLSTFINRNKENIITLINQLSYEKSVEYENDNEQFDHHGFEEIIFNTLQHEKIIGSRKRSSVCEAQSCSVMKKARDSERNDLQTQLDAKMALLEETHISIRKAEQAVQYCIDKISQADSEVQKMQAQVNEIESSRQEAEEINKKSQNYADAVKKRLSLCEASCEHLHKEARDLERDDLQTQLDAKMALLEETHISIRKAEQAVQYCINKISQADSEVQKMQAQVNEIESSRQEAEEINKKSQNDAVAVKKRLSLCEASCYYLHKVARDLEREELQTKLSQKMVSLTKTKKFIIKAEQSVQYCIDKISQADSEVQKMQAQVNKIESSIQKAEEINRKAQNDADVVRKQSLQCEALCNDLHKEARDLERDELQTQLDAKMALLVKTEKSIKKSEQSVQNCINKISQADSEVLTMQAQVNKIKSSIQEAEILVSKAKNEADAVKEKALRAEEVLEKCRKSSEVLRCDYLYEFQSTYDEEKAPNYFIYSQCQAFYGVDYSSSTKQINNSYVKIVNEIQKLSDPKRKARYMVVNLFVKSYLSSNKFLQEIVID